MFQMTSFDTRWHGSGSDSGSRGVKHDKVWRGVVWWRGSWWWWLVVAWRGVVVHRGYLHFLLRV